jgi:hypothetical protein
VLSRGSLTVLAGLVALLLELGIKLELEMALRLELEIAMKLELEMELTMFEEEETPPCPGIGHEFLSKAPPAETQDDS